MHSSGAALTFQFFYFFTKVSDRVASLQRHGPADKARQRDGAHSRSRYRPSSNTNGSPHATFLCRQIPSVRQSEHC